MECGGAGGATLHRLLASLRPRPRAHNTYDEFVATLEAIGRALGRPALDRLHIHISGIQYGPKGERKHEPLLETAFAWRDLLRALKDLRVGGWVVSESPCMEDDALLLQRTYHEL